MRTNSKFKDGTFQKGHTEAVSNRLKLPCQTAVSLKQFNQRFNQTSAGVYDTLMEEQEQQAKSKITAELSLFEGDFASWMQKIIVALMCVFIFIYNSEQSNFNKSSKLCSLDKHFQFIYSLHLLLCRGHIRIFPKH